MTEQQHRPAFSLERPPRPADVRTALAVIAYARELVTSVNMLPYGTPDNTLAEAQTQLERVLPWVTAAHPQQQGQQHHQQHRGKGKGGRR